MYYLMNTCHRPLCMQYCTSTTCIHRQPPHIRLHCTCTFTVHQLHRFKGNLYQSALYVHIIMAAQKKTAVAHVLFMWQTGNPVENGL